MFLLRIVEMLLLAFLVFLIVTQIIFPAIMGTRLFPLLYTSELRDEVISLKEEVGDLADKTKSLEALASLKKKKADLEVDIANITASVPPVKSDKE
jgi:hypothetical protein